MENSYAKSHADYEAFMDYEMVRDMNVDWISLEFTAEFGEDF